MPGPLLDGEIEQEIIFGVGAVGEPYFGMQAGGQQALSCRSFRTSLTSSTTSCIETELGLTDAANRSACS